MPIAIEVLRNNILAEGNLYPGDLLKSVLTVDAGFWNTHPDMKEEWQYSSITVMLSFPPKTMAGRSQKNYWPPMNH